MAVSFPHLLSPLQVGPKRLRNRVLVTAHVPGLAVAGVPGEDYVAYHRARAKGGVGLQVTGATPVHWSSTLGRSNAISNLDDRVIPGYWVAEMAFPWASLSRFTIGRCPPSVGDAWRAQFARAHRTQVGGNCTYWRPPALNRPRDTRSNPDAGHCVNFDKVVTGWVYHRPNATPIDGIAHIDLINEWVSTMETGRYFGCIHWTKKEKP